MENVNVLKKLFNLQQKLIVPKNERNDYGNFAYRSAEGILKQLKPLLAELQCIITLSDVPLNEGERYYVVSTATIIDIETGESYSCTSPAREEIAKQDMDESQITGASSSYARKYALCGLLAVDNSKDADVLNNNPAYTEIAREKVIPVYSSIDEACETVISAGQNKGKSIRQMYEYCKKNQRYTALYWVASHDPEAGYAAKYIIENDSDIKN